MRCECGQDALFSDCCGRFLDGSETPSTCQELVRARFVAFGLGNFDYIENTQMHPLSTEVRQRQAPEWERLVILECKDGGPDHQTGTVEFEAYYHADGLRIHHEVSHFERVEDEWRYIDGDTTDREMGQPRIVMAQALPCTCGSGKKFKHCCGVLK